MAAPGKQTEKGERRRAQLVSAASELLAEGGFDAIRHRAVAERAGVPLAATTYYFSSLEDLVGAALDRLGREELADARGCLDTRDDPNEIVLDLLLGPRSRTEGLDAVLRRFERLIGSGRRPFLAGLLREQRVEFDALLEEALTRVAGRRPRPGEVRRVTALVDGIVVTALIEAEPDPRGIAREALREAIAAV
ncbi:TetR family transcriptional regulator [Pseudonocardia sp. EC080610-09]|uniref:TetR/AcrR family transcriptional regulator n=1 Tax=unclassified Pseudonocardia TaxID=2619320 RepID=UPI0006CB7AB8|nr:MULTISPECIES: TetR family transcriptional regulator [unclassified Pseudonocardia]ALE75262.1 TetR family transcriptional regulator [Pseudonocardia sp. EC080625-04]ALL74625.1 TetR family transcriptional regulator [Pseudonocardia sp. EC080610-09]ALL81646.1 TetR family transcriptional regulator [Pseudonocardia sp. EC080619-01]